MQVRTKYAQCSVTFFLSIGFLPAMVEVQLLPLPASSVWNMGWCVHVLSDQHPWCCYLPQDGLDCGTLHIFHTYIYNLCSFFLLATFEFVLIYPRLRETG